MNERFTPTLQEVTEITTNNIAGDGSSVKRALENTQDSRPASQPDPKLRKIVTTPPPTGQITVTELPPAPTSDGRESPKEPPPITQEHPNCCEEIGNTPTCANGHAKRADPSGGDSAHCPPTPPSGAEQALRRLSTSASTKQVSAGGNSALTPVSTSEESPQEPPSATHESSGDQSGPSAEAPTCFNESAAPDSTTGKHVDAGELHVRNPQIQSGEIQEGNCVAPGEPEEHERLDVEPNTSAETASPQ